ncbi:MAG TPA: hypothetical protein VFZ09_22745 [Archangium sp.]|uniref:hypothetical protein n=1 Tax=Archangium sp. TaxID=1872627 RepID=UPI002E2EF707|nr:hypothetical protein [Archangium sp.]HEX5749078.1 hypothetical protein [Archangium sp.]
MSEGAKQPQQPRGTPSSTSMPRVSQTNNPRVMSAARTAPLPKEQQGPLSQKLKAESANVALNALSIVKEKVEEFREQDSFFKYKAFIVAGWVFLSVSTFGITCARGNVKQTGDFGAKLVPVTSRASLTIMNKSEDAWEKVHIVVTDSRRVEWNAFVPRVEPGKDITITPKQLLNASGQAAPSDIKIVGVEMRTDDGDAVLLENGKNLTDAQ